MMWFAMACLTFLAFQLIQGIYAVAQAVVGWQNGATVEAISVGFGPVLFEVRICGIAWRLSQFPTGAYTMFVGDPDELDSESISAVRVPFSQLLIASRMAIVLIGPVITILIGIFCVAIPVLNGGTQVVVDANLPEVWKKNGVPHLTINPLPVKAESQLNLFKSTATKFFTNIALFQSLQDWGGYLGWLSTCGSAALQLVDAWRSCFGVVVLAGGILNLLPIPMLNGWQTILLILEFVLGKIPKQVRVSTIDTGLILLLLVLGRMILQDINWLVNVR